MGWQFPQGGVDTALDVIEEARRELREEIGTDAIKVLRVSSRSYCYDFPHGVGKEGFRGQCHIWILAQLLISEEHINFEHLPAEFDGWQWVSAQQACDLIVPFKREAYQQGLIEFGLLADRT
jgi:putative (di)nucleoside polyphosphate hydrolase